MSTKTYSQHYLDGIKSGREALVRHSISIARDEVANLRSTIKGFPASNPVGQFLRGELDFWLHQLKKR